MPMPTKHWRKPACPHRAARMNAYAARAAARLPLDRDGPAAVDPPGRVLCWCCGTAAPGTSFLRKWGWRTRYISCDAGVVCCEAYCPGCHAAWGWPPLGPDWQAVGPPEKGRRRA